jgi:hypothetical protein
LHTTAECADLVHMATLTLMSAADAEDQPLAQLVWKHFESEICETLREVIEELSEHGQSEKQVSEEK